jgi:hypothetical protein
MTSPTKTLASTVIFLFPEDSEFPIGTAFIVGYPSPGKKGMVVPLVVTAKHVVGDLRRIVGRFTRKSGGIPAGVTYDLADLRRNGDLWEHPDDGVDLLVFRTTHFEEVDYEMVGMPFIASKKTFMDEKIQATDRVIFPCLLVNFMGASRNYPVIRDGSVALVPDEPVPLEYDVGNRRIRTEQEVILIDATSIAGASGSPIFLGPGVRAERGSDSLFATRPWLLGVMHGFYPALPRELVDVQVSKVIPAFRENSGIAIASPSWRLLEILEMEEVAKRVQQVVDVSSITTPTSP